MIFYFSGTGNSEWVAETIAAAQGDFTKSIAEAMRERDFCFNPAKDEAIGFVFPVHSWGVPCTVLKFISQLVIPEAKERYTFFVATCGDDIGMTSHIFRKAVKKIGLHCDCGFSVQMPNTYILMQGFDVDPQKLQQTKLATAENRLEEINECIKSRKKGVFNCRKGVFPIFKSYVIRPLFNRGMKDKPFHTEGWCSQCKVCVHSCPVSNIRLKGDGPVWQGHCVQCLACIHKCPLRVIQYGKATQNKGRYTFGYGK